MPRKLAPHLLPRHFSGRYTRPFLAALCFAGVEFLEVYYYSFPSFLVGGIQVQGSISRAIEGISDVTDDLLTDWCD